MTPTAIDQQTQKVGFMIPCPPAKFGEFMSNLLGKPQITRGLFLGSFSISLADIENFYHLIQQRIEEQNGGTLVSFSSLIKFNDGTSFEVTSLEALRSYSEIRPVVSEGVTLTFIYLVTFQNRDIPERQQIDIDIMTKNESYFGYPHFLMIEDSFKFPDPLSYGEKSTGIIAFRITHTARTWGSDIENLLKEHISGLFIEETNKVRRFVRSWKNVMLHLCAISTYSFVTVAIYNLLSSHEKTTKEKYNVVAPPDLENLEKIIRKIDFIFSNIVGPQQPLAAIALVICMLAAVIMSYLWSDKLIKYATSPLPSFIVLTRKAEADKNTKLAKHKKHWLNFIVGFLVSVLAGVGGNIVTALINN